MNAPLVLGLIAWGVLLAVILVKIIRAARRQAAIERAWAAEVRRRAQGYQFLVPPDTDEGV